MVCLQETMFEKCEPRDWNLVERGFLEGFLAIDATGRSMAMVVAWSEIILSKVDMWSVQFSTAANLKREDRLGMTVVLVYGRMNVTRRKDLWRELVGVADTFQGSPLLIGGDFNVTLELTDRPNSMGRTDIRGWPSKNGAYGLCIYVE